MAQRQRQQRSTRSYRQQENGRRNDEFQEEDGFGTAWHRPDAEDGQPGMTGEGLDPDGNPVRLSLFFGDKNGRPYRSRNGVRFARFHIEPPYEGDPADKLEEPDEDEFPF